MLNPISLLLFRKLQPSTERAKPTICIQPLDWHFTDDSEATVTETISPGRKGWVRFHATSWSARCLQATTLPPDTIVAVLGRCGNTLIVKPIS